MKIDFDIIKIIMQQGNKIDICSACLRTPNCIEVIIRFYCKNKSYGNIDFNYSYVNGPYYIAIDRYNGVLQELREEKLKRILNK